MTGPLAIVEAKAGGVSEIVCCKAGLATPARARKVVSRLPIRLA